jgi:tryptophan-rich sensory protein
MMRFTQGSLFRLVVCIAACLAAGGIGSAYTTSAIPTWYATLAKPDFTPPSWLFAPVWTALYLMMGYAAWLVWEQKHRKPRVMGALSIFSLQLALNVAWSMVFFGLHSIVGGLCIIITLWIIIAWTIRRFLPISKNAARLLLPYLAWVSYALALNYAIWKLNS